MRVSEGPFDTKAMDKRVCHGLVKPTFSLSAPVISPPAFGFCLMRRG